MKSFVVRKSAQEAGKDVHTAVRLTQETYARLRELSAATRKSRSAVIRELIQSATVIEENTEVKS